MASVSAARRAPQGRPASSRRAAAGRAVRTGRGGGVFSVPERFMRPQLLFIAAVGLLTGFGLLMVYSASSVTALTDFGDAAYYLKRQLLLGGAGLVAAVVLALVDYHVWTRRALMAIWLFTVVLLALVFTPFAGGDAYGASRWIVVAGIQVQPSEFAKITIVLTAANLAFRLLEEGLDKMTFVKLALAGVVLPLFLIFKQPDKGSTMVLGLTLLVMAFLAGVSPRLVVTVLVVGLVGFLVVSLMDDYSRQRFLTMLDPWADPTGTGYQLAQGFYAFGSGGLFGVGIGASREKYSYLPMAHNDFIFAIIGEECGLVGTLGMLAGFAVVLWAGLKIAQHAPDLEGRLIAAGCTSLLIVQTLLNVAGVLGLFPLSGKPIPFISYGGTSIMASLMIAGLVVSVSRHSRLPETRHDSVRRTWRALGPEDDGELSLVGEPQPRSRRGESARERAAADARGSFTVVDGGAAPGARGGRYGSARGGSGRTGGARGGSSRPAGGDDRGRPRGRVSTDARGRRRIDLGPSASDRLRGGRDSGPRTRR